MSELLVSQKNEILEYIKKSGLDPFNFSWKRTKSGFGNEGPQTVPLLEYNDSPYYFKFDDFRGGHYAVFSPGQSTVTERQNSNNPTLWPVTLSCFRRWLAYLKRELSQPDLWKQLSQYRISGITLPEQMPSNEPFSYQQVQDIADGIHAIRDYIGSTMALSSEQNSFLHQQLDYLVDASKRQGKNDWLHTSIGVMFSLAVALAMSPEQTQNIWKMLKAAITGVIQLLP